MQLSPEGHAALREFERGRAAARSSTILAVTAVAGFILAILGAVYLVPAQQAQSAGVQKDAAVSQARSVSDPLLQLCADGGETAKVLRDSGLCGKAASLASQPTQAAPATVTAPPVVITETSALPVPMPLPVTSVVQIPGPVQVVTAPGTTSPVTVTQTPVTKTQTVTQTQEAPPPPATETQTETQTKTETQTETTGPPPLVVVNGG